MRTSVTLSSLDRSNSLARICKEAISVLYSCLGTVVCCNSSILRSTSWINPACLPTVELSALSFSKASTLAVILLIKNHPIATNNAHALSSIYSIHFTLETQLVAALISARIKLLLFKVTVQIKNSNEPSIDTITKDSLIIQSLSKSCYPHPIRNTCHHQVTPLEVPARKSNYSKSMMEKAVLNKKRPYLHHK